MDSMRKLVFSFDEYSLESLEKIKQQDFKEILIHNPETREKRVLVIPELVTEQR